MKIAVDPSGLQIEGSADSRKGYAQNRDDHSREACRELRCTPRLSLSRGAQLVQGEEEEEDALQRTAVMKSVYFLHTGHLQGLCRVELSFAAINAASKTDVALLACYRYVESLGVLGGRARPQFDRSWSSTGRVDGKPTFAEAPQPYCTLNTLHRVRSPVNLGYFISWLQKTND